MTKEVHMSVKRFKSLLFKSARIQEEIEREQRSRWPDWMRLYKLKKLRLAIKDHMIRLMRHQPNGQMEPVKVKTRSAKKNQLRDV